MPFQVVAIQQEVTDCWTLTLQAQDRQPFSFLPGQFVMLYCFGHGEVPISISGDSGKSKHLVLTIRDVGAVTHAITALETDAVVGIRGPFGHGWPMQEAVGKDILVIAGGLGLAPLRPAIYHLLNTSTGNHQLLYGSRTPETLVFPNEYGEWEKQGLQVSVTVDNAGREWNGHVGIVTQLIEQTQIQPQNNLALLCGPEIMMRFCAYALLDKGMEASQIYVSMERNMQCAIGLCGRCQHGTHFICRDGPVFSFDRVKHLFRIREV